MKKKSFWHRQVVHSKSNFQTDKHLGDILVKILIAKDCSINVFIARVEGI